MSNAVMHTIEHIFATYIRNSSYADQVVYFGPMGCRTGFYLLLFDTMSNEEVLSLIRQTFSFIADYTGEIPGCRKEECGNYMEHDLQGARAEAQHMCRILSEYSENQMTYPQ